MSSAGIQKVFCGIYSAFKCSFDEFVGEKVFSPSYSSAILAPPPIGGILNKQVTWSDHDHMKDILVKARKMDQNSEPKG